MISDRAGKYLVELAKDNKTKLIIVFYFIL